MCVCALSRYSFAPASVSTKRTCRVSSGGSTGTCRLITVTTTMIKNTIIFNNNNNNNKYSLSQFCLFFRSSYLLLFLFLSLSNPFLSASAEHRLPRSALHPAERACEGDGVDAGRRSTIYIYIYIYIYKSRRPRAPLGARPTPGWLFLPAATGACWIKSNAATIIYAFYLYIYVYVYIHVYISISISIHQSIQRANNSKVDMSE